MSEALPSTPRWRVSERPLVRIGTSDFDAQDYLYRVTGAVRLQDGRIAVANAGSWEVRSYSPSGAFLDAQGRRGRGPGEFQYVSNILRYRGDSLIVYDFRARRFSVLDAGGHFGRSFSMVGPDDESSYVTLTGVASEGSLLMLTSTPIVPDNRATISRPVERLFRYTPKGLPAGLVRSVEGRERFVGPGGAAGPRRFGARTVVRVHGETIFVGSTENYEIGAYGLDGALRRLIRKTHVAVPVEPRHVALDREQLQREAARFAGLPAVIRRGQEALVADMPYPAVFPAFADFLVDDSGGLWVRDYVPPGDTQAIWSVYDRDGHLVALVDVPTDFTIYDVSSTHLLVGRKDALDVEYVELHAVVHR